MRWSCSRCFYREDTPPRHLAPMHNCSGLLGMSIPLAPEGERVGHIVNERDVAEAPIMSVSTEHLNGRVDCTVYPLPVLAGFLPTGGGEVPDGME